jgi:hypothetical protein
MTTEITNIVFLVLKILGLFCVLLVGAVVLVASILS